MLDFTPTQKEYLYNCLCGDCRDIINPVGSSMIIREDISYQGFQNVNTQLINLVYLLEHNYLNSGYQAKEFKEIVAFVFGQLFLFNGVEIVNDSIPEEDIATMTAVINYAVTHEEQYLSEIAEAYKKYIEIHNDIPEIVQQVVKTIRSYLSTGEKIIQYLY